MKVWNGSAWLNAYASLSGALLSVNNLSDLASASTARTNLGLGTAATTASSSYATAAQGTKADSALQTTDIGTTVQGYDGDLQAIGNISGTSGLLKKTAANTWSLDTNSYLTSAVTSVGGTAPISSSGGNTPAISISKANTSTDGYLSATDWNTFNNKGSGTVTSVTGTAPVVSSGGATPAISMAKATSLVDGYLSATDWNTFNNKGSGSVTSVGGTGTVSGISLSGTVTSSGNLTLGGSIDLSTPPAIGATTPSTGKFTDLTDTSLTSGRVTYAGTGGNLTDASNFTYDGTNLVAGAIQNTPIGSTTASTGKFTTLEATETSSLGTASAQYIQAIGDATYPQVVAAGSGTNIPLVLQPKGTGALQAQLTDSTTTGGNARGANAVDWQTNRSAATRVASATYSVVGGGQSNTASSQGSVVCGGVLNTASTNLYASILGGNGNTASGIYSGIVSGYSNSATGYYGLTLGGFTNSTTANAAVTTQSATMNGTTSVTLSGSNAAIKVGQVITGTSIASHTYVAAISGTALTLSQAASGSSTSTLSFYTPHGVVVGGGNNQATGSYSFIGGGGDAGTSANRNTASGDWSFVGGGVKNTASGVGSFVGGGGTDGSTGIVANTASGGASAIVGGLGNLSSGQNSFIGGGFGHTSSSAYASILGGYAHTANSNSSSVVSGRAGTTRGINGNAVFPANNNPLGATGASQSALLVLARQTTDATATVLASDSAAAGTANQVILPNNSAYYFTGEIIAGVTGAGNTKGWSIAGVIKRGANAASTAVVGTPTVTSSYADAGAAAWTVAVAADTTNGGLKITVTGAAATTIRWVARVKTVEMTY